MLFCSHLKTQEIIPYNDIQHESKAVKYQADIVNIGRGLLMGGADAIPGVSGGTVALILGIYEQLVTAISRFDTTLLKQLRQKEFKAAAEYIDLRFLVTLLIGIVGGLGVMILAVKFVLVHHLHYTLAAFFGMIIASSLLVFRMITSWNPITFVMLFTGTAFAFWLVGTEAMQNPPETYWYLFLCGVVSISAMILPGISGAFILLILARYTMMSDLIKSFLKLKITADEMKSLVVFVCGTVVGILCFSKLLRWLLARYEMLMLSLLCGFMLGSLRKLWPFFKDNNPLEHDLKKKVLVNIVPDFSTGDTWATLLILIISAGLVLALEAWSIKKEYV